MSDQGFCAHCGGEMGWFICDDHHNMRKCSKCGAKTGYCYYGGCDDCNEIERCEDCIVGWNGADIIEWDSPRKEKDDQGLWGIVGYSFKYCPTCGRKL